MKRRLKTGKVVIVGGTGMVGHELMTIMRRHCLQPTELIITGHRTAGRQYKTAYGLLPVKPLTLEVFHNAQFIFLAAGSDVSLEWVPKLRGGGAKIIDLSSAFRYDKKVPLVIPAINGWCIPSSDLIACPNCTTSIALMPLSPLHRAFGIEHVYLTSYQAASGAGKDALEALERQVKHWAKHGHPDKVGHTGNMLLPLAGNLIPRIDVIQDGWDGYTKEEMKTQWETNKILFEQKGGHSVPVISTCVRVPVRRCHSEVLIVKTQQRVTVESINETLSRESGVVILDDPDNNVFPTPLRMECQEAVGVGRIRLDPSADGHGFCMFVCGDQLWRGAALTAVEIMESVMTGH